MKRRTILSFCASGHGFSGALCIDGKIVAATTLERLSRVKYDILFPISLQDLQTFGWKGDPTIYQRGIDLPFDLENDYSFVDFNELEKFHTLMEYLLGASGC